MTGWQRRAVAGAGSLLSGHFQRVCCMQACEVMSSSLRGRSRRSAARLVRRIVQLLAIARCPLARAVGSSPRGTACTPSACPPPSRTARSPPPPAPAQPQRAPPSPLPTPTPALSRAAPAAQTAPPARPASPAAAPAPRVDGGRRGCTTGAHGRCPAGLTRLSAARGVRGSTPAAGGTRARARPRT
jgi:hypothetical protein